MTCPICNGTEWVCENHPDRSWGDGENDDSQCECGAGMPCPTCNPADRDHPPRPLAGSREIWNIHKGWIN